jgi:hypothetical protein
VDCDRGHHHIADGCANVGRLSAILVTCSLLLSGGSAGLAFSKQLGGLFLGHPLAYYGLLIGLCFGLVEALHGFYVSRALEKRGTLRLTLLCLSLLPVAAFVGFIWKAQVVK